MLKREFGDFLHDISQCFIDRDITGWRGRMTLPFSVVSKTGPVVLTTEKAVARNFALYLKACDILQLDLIVRNALSLEDCGDGTWLGTYETRLVRGNLLTTAPYTSTSLLQMVDGRFRMSSILNGRGHHEWTGDTEN